MYKVDKIRAHREELKRLWFSLPVSQEEIKTITIRMTKNKHWPGYGDVTILSDGPNGYSHFSTHQEHPMEYALNCEEYKSGEYKLVIKE